jgi:hypothetical protein
MFLVLRNSTLDFSALATVTYNLLRASIHSTLAITFTDATGRQTFQ